MPATWRPLPWLAAVAALALIASPVAADETTFCTATISALPYSINTPGRYCFASNLSTSGVGTAIRVNAHDVTIDLNRFQLVHTGGPSVNSYGIYGYGRRNVTIRNGTIRGFGTGLGLNGVGSLRHLVEDIRAEGNYYQAILVVGDSSIVRRCNVIDTGGSAISPSFAFGIHAAGTNTQILDNSIVNTFATASGGFAAGINSGQSDTTIFDNRVFSVTGASTNYGILCNGGGVVPLVRDNAVIDAASPYAGCTPVESPNYP